MNCLELCSGSASFTKAASQWGNVFNTVTVDISPRYNPTHCVDLHEFDETQYPAGHFAMVWCSCECTEYSMALRNRPRDLVKADALATRCMELLGRYIAEGATGFLENPHSSLLWKQIPAAANLPWVILDYCAYGSLHKKRTRVAGNGLRGFLPRLCPGTSVCPSEV